jgi:hypothetical protein
MAKEGKGKREAEIEKTNDISLCKVNIFKIN